MACTLQRWLCSKSSRVGTLVGPRLLPESNSPGQYHRPFQWRYRIYNQRGKMTRLGKLFLRSHNFHRRRNLCTDQQQ